MASNECQELINAYPGYEPRPREGCPAWNRTNWRGDVRELIAWNDARGDKAIAWTSYGFEWAQRGTTVSTVITDYTGTPLPAPTPGSSICWQRVEGALILGSDDPNGWAKIIEWDTINRAFYWRNANIKPLPGMYLRLSLSTDAGKLTPERWYSYTFTLVNHGRLDGVDHSKVFIPGILESSEDLNKRVLIYLPAGFTSIHVDIVNPSEWVDFDPQANYVRIYRTQPQLSEEEAKGFTHGWLTDIPGIILGTTVELIDKEAGTEIDASPVTSGLNVMPPCKSMIYMNGRLWINGAFGGSPGRWWYSSGIQNAVSYLKHLTLFALSTDFKDCSLDDAQEATGAAIAGGDLYFFNSRSIFRLADGDVKSSPSVVSTNVGCPFPRTITGVNTWAFFLSSTGPKMIQGGAIDPVKGFKRGEVWPNSREGGSILRYGRENGSHSVIGFWYRETWWIAAGDIVVGYRIDEASGVNGSLRVVFADPGMSLNRVVVFSDEEALMSGSDRRMIWFLRNEDHTDCGYWITVTVKTKRLFVDVKDSSKRAEPYDIRIGARCTDKGSLKVRLVGDDEMFRKTFTYQQRTQAALLQEQGIPQGAINSYQQPVPYGLLASHFDLTVEKMIRPPFDFSMTSAEIQVIPKSSRAQMSVSIALGVDDPVDLGMAIIDVEDVGTA
jgi:hypothetical protein